MCEDKVKKEKVLLAEIYSEDGNLSIDLSKSVKTFELYGFLKCYVNLMEKELEDTFSGSGEFRIF